MCFHSKQTKLALEVENRFNAKIDRLSEFKSQKYVNGFEFPKTPVIIDEHPDVITHFSWGLIPSWAKDPEIRKYTLNAKIETLNEKPSFRNSINKRCLVIANGFYEWQWQDAKGKSKIKYEIGLSEEELFAFAGIYSEWINQYTGEIVNTYALLTTEANAFMAKIHNSKKRMPVILKKEDEQSWLNSRTPIDSFRHSHESELIAKVCRM
jgi:putative SOS response-associated peptidase YedK